MTNDTTTPPAAPKKKGGLSLALDFGPLLLFFLAYKMGGVFVGTGVFMVAILVAVLIAKLVLGKVTPMLWTSAILVIGFGGLTIYFHDPKFIQLKPTLIYALFAIILFGGLLVGRPMLKYLLEAAYDGLSDAGWRKLSRNWALFFVGMAILNEVLRLYFTFDEWLTIKTWGLTILSLVFAAANVPMLMRHGLNGGEMAEEPPVPPQE
jgi:intracellular septation protein